MELHVVNAVVLAAPGIDVLIFEPNKLVRLILIIFFWLVWYLQVKPERDSCAPGALFSTAHFLHNL